MVKQVSPSRGNGFVRRRVYRIPHPLPLPFKLLCFSRDVEEKGDKNQGDISRIDVHAGLEDRSRLILSVLSDAESSGREKGESYARVGLVKGIRIEIRSIDARLVSFDDSFSFCFSPFPLLLFQIILLSEIVRVARIETAAYWSSECSLLQNVLNRSKSFFLCVCFNFLFFFFVMLCCFGCFCHKKLTREKVENRDRLIGKRNFEEKNIKVDRKWRGRYSRIKFVKEIVEFRFCL